ncbi:MAG: Asp-tRNA(Asn)/Glu-tRNA(Gln) amidotransferase subunit GatA [Alphaproteobacteria bacterium]
MEKLVKFTFKDLKNLLQKKEVSVKEVVTAYIAEAEKNRHLNIYITETFDQALEKAKESDLRYKKNEARPLEGLPLAIKDLFCTKGVKTTAASKILDGFIPPYDSTVTEKLFHAGVVSMGKTNTDEFAMGSSTITSCYGPSINPWRSSSEPDADLTSGGSSGGSASAVAAGTALAGIGTDTGGSIRQPASLCGLVGIKPTYGLCSRFGVVAFASSLDHPSPIGRTVYDTAMLLEYMAGHDPKDSTSLNIPVPQYTKTLTGNVKGLKIGIPKEYDMPGIDPEIKSLWEKSALWFQEMGAEIIPISLPHTKYGLPTYYIIAPAEASSNLARYDGVRYGLRADGKSMEQIYSNTRTRGFGDEVTRRILIGTYVLSSGSYEDYYVRAQRVRRKVADDFVEAFKTVDLILTPTTSGEAFKLGENIKDPIAMYLQDIFTVTSNLAGVPAISLPAGLSKNNLPLGMQLIGPALSESLLFNAAYALETFVNFEIQPIKEI